jgi:hypothetical protein
MSPFFILKSKKDKPRNSSNQDQMTSMAINDKTNYSGG